MKRIILTGSSSGLGASIAQVFYDSGYEIVGLCRSEPANFIHWLPTDLTDEASIQKTIQKIQNEFSTFDIIIHCAGDGDGEDIKTLDWKNTQRQFSLNMIAPAILTSGLFELIQKNEADIVGIGATIGFKPYKYFSMYGASKWAFRGWIENLQLELKGTPCRVIGIHPGGMETIGNTKRMNQIEVLTQKINPGVFMKTDHVANLLFQIVNLPKNIEVSELIINRK